MQAGDCCNIGVEWTEMTRRRLDTKRVCSNLTCIEFLRLYFYVYYIQMLAKIHSTETMSVKANQVDVLCYKCVCYPPIEQVFQLSSFISLWFYQESTESTLISSIQ
jgi:hypothetical protein